MHISKKEILVTGLALLAMFVGAGNLIFPPLLGLNAGVKLFPAVAGFILTGVGLPLLGVTAVAKAGGDLEFLANRVHPLFSKIITTIVILSIGPLLAIPRTAATVFEVGIAPFISDSGVISNQLALFITSLIFFAICIFFVLKPLKIVDNIGKFLTPFIIILLAIIIFKGATSPLGDIGHTKYTTPFTEGFIEGYNTMDALASVIFGLVIANVIRSKGVTNQKEVAQITIFAGIIAAIGLSAIYIGLCYVGATTGTTYTGNNPGELLSYIVEALLGQYGKIILAAVMALACITTAIGLISSCGAFFNRLSGGKVSYNAVCIVTTIISLILANMGLVNILDASKLLLTTIYPVIIVLILLSIFHELFKGKRAVYVATVSGTVFIAISDAILTLTEQAGIKLETLDSIFSLLPLQQQGLGWVFPALVMAFLGICFKKEYLKL